MADFLPPLQTIRAFRAVAERGSFTAAATALNLTQTAISHQIAQLEEWVGAPLLQRERRGASLTPTGRSLLRPLADALEQMERALVAARSSRSLQCLRISTTPEFGVHWLGPRLERFSAAHPGIQVSMTTQYRPITPDGTDTDVAIWLGGGDATGVQRLMLDEEFAVSSPELASRLPPSQAILAAPLLRYEGARHTLLDWRRWCERMLAPDTLADLDYEAGPLFSSFSSMLAACRQGDGLALVRSSLVAEDLAHGKLVRCFVEAGPSDLHYQLIVLPAQRRRPEVRTFIEWILAEVE